MKHSDAAYKKMYQHLGFLFYAISAADQNIRNQELAILKQIVEKEWTVVEDSLDEFGEDMAYQIEVTFDWLVEDYGDAMDCFNKFQFYYKENESMFDDKLKILTLKTAYAIAGSFAGANKSERNMLQELEELLDM